MDVVGLTEQASGVRGAKGVEESGKSCGWEPRRLEWVAGVGEPPPPAVADTHRRECRGMDDTALAGVAAVLCIWLFLLIRLPGLQARRLISLLRSEGPGRSGSRTCCAPSGLSCCPTA